MSKVFTHKNRVYYEDTDSGGVMYHANYLNFFERTRTEWLRSKNIGQRKLREQSNIVFAVCDMHIEYIKPAYLDDVLELNCEMKQIKNASMLIEQQMYSNNILLATAKVKVAVLRAHNFKPTRFPAELKREIML
ncbi:MAG: tol-pal system-associated acyl-CoA thioesterase [Proteobacteria bacterium]|nr:tol-pal system-associated acyl-CoA thioesterase [Pseudomonadota bacterium]